MAKRKKVSEMCHVSDEPIHVTKNGYADMVIMSSDAYDELARMANANRTVAAIQEGIEAIRRGKCQDAYEALNVIRKNMAYRVQIADPAAEELEHAVAYIAVMLGQPSAATPGALTAGWAQKRRRAGTACTGLALLF